MEKKAAELHKELYLPIDQVVAEELEQGAQTKIVWTMDFGSGKVCFQEKHGSKLRCLQDIHQMYWQG